MKKDFSCPLSVVKIIPNLFIVWWQQLCLVNILKAHIRVKLQKTVVQTPVTVAEQHYPIDKSLPIAEVLSQLIELYPLDDDLSSEW